MDTAAFDYGLPRQRIAQVPVEPRHVARLLVDRGADGGGVEHRTVADLPDVLGVGDLLVLNTTRVLAARLKLHKATGGAAEVLLLEPVGTGSTDPSTDRSTWMALVRPGRRLAPGTLLYTADGAAVVEVGASEPSSTTGGDGGQPENEDGSRPFGDDQDDTRRSEDDPGMRRVRLLGDADAIMRAAGHVPLPPYITAPLSDAERYQTVYADRPGSVAAPTAGLHLTEDVLARCRQRGVQVATVELAVGLGTFRPISATKVEHHTMHAESYVVPPETMAACAAAERVVAVGTTTVRALESAAATGALVGRTELFIRRPYPFAVVDALLTNFHQPCSSLLVMIDAFVGPRWRDLYELALAEQYRFLSFGDAMFLTRTDAASPA